MNTKQLFKQAHKMTKEIKVKHKKVDYAFQFSLCLKYITSQNKQEQANNERRQACKVLQDYQKRFFDYEMHLNIEIDVIQGIASKGDEIVYKRGLLCLMKLDTKEEINKFIKLYQEMLNDTKALKEEARKRREEANPRLQIKREIEQKQKEIKEKGLTVCPRCHGLGKIEIYRHNDNGFCYRCKGRGHL